MNVVYWYECGECHEPFDEEDEAEEQMRLTNGD